jgi:hypothetical protein
MAAPEHITAQIRAYISESVLPVLPDEIRLVSFEVVSWLVTMHMYQHEAFSDRSCDALEERVERLAEALPPRADEPWQAVPAYHRRDPEVPLDPEGEVVYAASYEGS